VDPQHYPWYAVGAAAVLGFVTATSVWAPADHRPQPTPPAASQAAARPSWTASLFRDGAPHADKHYGGRAAYEEPTVKPSPVYPG